MLAVAVLAQRYLEEHVEVRCKAKTAESHRQAVGKHILPALGAMPALAVDHAAVTALHHSLRATPVMANRVVDVLSRIYNAAEDKGLIPEVSNPCRLVAKNRERARERFLTDGEFRRLGRVLDEAETCKGVSVHALAAIRLLLLTGCSATRRWRPPRAMRISGKFRCANRRCGFRGASGAMCCREPREHPGRRSPQADRPAPLDRKAAWPARNGIAEVDMGVVNHAAVNRSWGTGTGKMAMPDDASEHGRDPGLLRFPVAASPGRCGTR